jgi:2-oxoacid:acceptor oxidoreductase gamma subunit (pyruvate/2-ketoisovalerate family)/2-oxoacid:acceptor oxidoreductase delta subunit (pyruvate/2-ketoisovalerate family)
MTEIRFHGRGGQGAVVASEILAHAAFREGHWVQSFPFFGVERRGSPVTAYARVEEHPILLRTSIQQPEIVVVLDPGLPRVVPVTEGLREGGLLLLNATHPPASLSLPPRARVALVDANRIALAHRLGSRTMPIVNTVMLGALAKVSGVVGLPALLGAIGENVPVKVPENQEAASEGFAQVALEPGIPGPAPAPQGPAPPVIPEAPVATIPSSTLHTSTWRTLVPSIHLDGCTRCEFCWKFCPDDAIGLDEQGFPHVREAYCKGCGICAEECPPKVIDMVPEVA